ncbi:MAG TPA: ATP phosphoribosyltransferase regulatory subunit, partial [Caldimonas sp.]
PPPAARAPIAAPRDGDAALHSAVRELRARGEIVVAALDDGSSAGGGRRLVASGDGWIVAQR